MPHTTHQAKNFHSVLRTTCSFFFFQRAVHSGKRWFSNLLTFINGVSWIYVLRQPLLRMGVSIPFREIPEQHRFWCSTKDRKLVYNVHFGRNTFNGWGVWIYVLRQPLLRMGVSLNTVPGDTGATQVLVFHKGPEVSIQRPFLVSTDSSIGFFSDRCFDNDPPPNRKWVLKSVPQ